MAIANVPGLSIDIKSRFVTVGDLDIHVLETSPSHLEQSEGKAPLLILLHGFPEIAYSWRKVMQPLAQGGFVVVAPDQRGFGRTKEHNQQPRAVSFEEDLAPYRMSNMVNDVIGLVHALGYDSVAAVVGHDYGSAVAAHCALMHPEIFKSVVLMSSPFGGVSNEDTGSQTMFQKIDEMLAKLDPPRKHYMMYYSTPNAADEMLHPPGGLHAFLRAYYHVKSADWTGNDVHPLNGFSPEAFSTLPHYYIMPLDRTMVESVFPDAPSEAEAETNIWLPNSDLAVYVSEYTTTGFQGGLNSYRCRTDPSWQKDLNHLVGKQIEVPAMFMAGMQDWGTYQFPGVAEKMKSSACRNMLDEDFVLIEKAGHWVQQEQPEAVISHILRFVKKNL